jgi:dipeptidyl aminopeptidase/acylaminoacyl peptidase
LADRTVAPFGSWPSPIDAATVARAGVALFGLEVSGDDVYWLEGRPLEQGRVVLVRRDGTGGHVDVTPKGFNVRTRVHEYGGGSVLVDGGTVFFSNYQDQRLYRQDDGAEPVPITPAPPETASLRYADARLVPGASVLVCVRERHESGAVRNELVAVPADGSAEPRVVASGNDFYASPRPSPDGRRLAWLAWNFPNMPWDGTELWTARLNAEAGASDPTLVAGGLRESVYQPDWSPDGMLHFVSDRTGWWNLYRAGEAGIEALMPMEAEFGVPQWTLGTRSYALLDEGRIAAVFEADGIQRLGVVVPAGRMEILDLPYTSFPGPYVSYARGRLWFIGASGTEASAVVSLDASTGVTEVVKRSLDLDVDPDFVSLARPIDFPTSDGDRAHALFYAPANPGYQGPPDERPPLVVATHGGPTSRTVADFNLEIQFFTSRGIGVVDVNYRGSTGYGRAYREALNGRWGEADVEDCVAAARSLVQAGEADGALLAIRGGSAGGFTTLAALTTRDDFAAGASYYGVSDLAALARDTHKFESRYLDGLVGPYSEAQEVYRARSPIHHVDRLATPVIVFQGLDDAVVPPAQAEVIVDALRRKGLPYAYLTFEGEEHGFRRAETVQRCLEAELSFYAQIMGFEPADGPEPIEIENLPHS